MYKTKKPRSKPRRIETRFLIKEKNKDDTPRKNQTERGEGSET